MPCLGMLTCDQPHSCGNAKVLASDPERENMRAMLKLGLAAGQETPKQLSTFYCSDVCHVGSIISRTRERGGNRASGQTTSK